MNNTCNSMDESQNHMLSGGREDKNTVWTESEGLEKDFPCK